MFNGPTETFPSNVYAFLLNRPMLGCKNNNIMLEIVINVCVACQNDNKHIPQKCFRSMFTPTCIYWAYFFTN